MTMTDTPRTEGANGRVVARFRGARDWSTTESLGMIERAFANR